MCVCVCVCVQVKDSLEHLRMEMEALVKTGGKQQQGECQPCNQLAARGCSYISLIFSRLFYIPFSSPSLPLSAAELPGMADHQMRSVFAQLLQGQAEIKQQLADLQRQCSQVGRRGEGRGGGAWQQGRYTMHESPCCSVGTRAMYITYCRN